MAVQKFMIAVLDACELTQSVVDRLFESGCNDATVSLRNGAVWIAFDREADSLGKALDSALDDVRKANIGSNFRFYASGETLSKLRGLSCQAKEE